ncbi:MAG TPA: hypothetical protein VJV78_39215 [Polyangiales bacterium]|nr:hypothetical protein [Polyangiales bacterium]
MQRKHFLVATAALVVISGACSGSDDYVAPGYYGAVQAGTASCVQPSAGNASAPATRVEEAADVAKPSSGAGGSMTPSASSSRCDLSGRWILTTHTTTDAIGQLQHAHYYLYYDIVQQGASFSVRKGLICGTDAIGGGAFAVNVDFSSARAAIMRKLSGTGRTGRSSESGTGCKIEVDKFYLVLGATLPYYLDPSRALPSVDDKADGNTPGWEDWDQDGNPGITGVVSGILSGKVFTAPRSWMWMTGEARDVRASFRLPLQWDAEPNVMAVDGSPLLASDAVRAADPKLHFAEFARLQPDQATGDDDTICSGIRQLAPKLTPTAAGL